MISPFSSKEKLSELILSLGFKEFSIEEKNGLFVLKTLTFSNLKKIVNSLAVSTRKLPIILPPERAFLIFKNWSFFDAFEKSDDLLLKINPLDNFSIKNNAFSQNEFPLKEPDFGFFLTKGINFNYALNSNEEEAAFLINSSAWSNLLSVPIKDVPKSINNKLELFLEKIFFKHGESVSFDSGETVYFSNGFELPTSKDPFSKIDFSQIWSELFLKNFFNIGTKTINCSCCKPFILDAKNLLPSSRIMIKFTEDNTYYESSSKNFSINFHKNYPFKRERLTKKKEFFTSSIPIGPFFKDDKALIPLIDAKRLINQKKAILVSSRENSFQNLEQINEFSQESNLEKLSGKKVDEFENNHSRINEQINRKSEANLHELNWFCLKKESFFSKEIRRLNLTLFFLSKTIDENNPSLFSRKNFSKIYSTSLHNSITSLLKELPNQLTNPNSKFFSPFLAKIIFSIQEATIARFKEFSENNGYRFLYASKNSAFVKGFSSLKLAKEFARETSLPQPRIAEFIKFSKN